MKKWVYSLLLLAVPFLMGATRAELNAYFTNPKSKVLLARVYYSVNEKYFTSKDCGHCSPYPYQPFIRNYGLASPYVVTIRDNYSEYVSGITVRAPQFPDVWYWLNVYPPEMWSGGLSDGSNGSLPGTPLGDMQVGQWENYSNAATVDWWFYYKWLTPYIDDPGTRLGWDDAEFRPDRIDVAYTDGRLETFSGDWVPPPFPEVPPPPKERCKIKIIALPYSRVTVQRDIKCPAPK